MNTSRRAAMLRSFNKEQLEGFKAGEQGSGPFANPYSSDPKRHASWKNGWRASYGYLEPVGETQQLVLSVL